MPLPGPSRNLIVVVLLAATPPELTIVIVVLNAFPLKPYVEVVGIVTLPSTSTLNLLSPPTVASIILDSTAPSGVASIAISIGLYVTLVSVQDWSICNLYSLVELIPGKASEVSTPISRCVPILWLVVTSKS